MFDLAKKVKVDQKNNGLTSHNFLNNFKRAYMAGQVKGYLARSWELD